MHRFTRVSALCVALAFFAAACAPVAETVEEVAPEPREETGESAEVDEGEEGEAEEVDEAEPEPEPEADVDVPAAAPVDGQLQVHFLDVGQADATLLVHEDVTVLIDQGGWQRSDVVGYLRSFGVEGIDLLITTNPHADHIGQFDQVMQAFQVDEVWWSGYIHTTRTFERAVAALEASDAAYEEPRAGDSATIGPLVIDVVNPHDDANFNDIHDSNLAFRISFGEVTFLFTGDAESATEARMVARHRALLDVDILQLGHHGSSTSTTQAFLDAVNPSYAIYSAGAGNTYGHPHREVIDRLNTAGIPIYGTDVHGTITVTTDGTTFEIGGWPSQ